MEKIKVLHITQGTIGGTLEYIKLFFDNIDREIYEVCLICPTYGPMKKDIEDMGITVYPVEMSREINIRNDLKSFLEINKLIKLIKPDIVHLHSSKAGIIGKFSSYFNKIPCVYNAHGWSFSMNISEKKKKIYAFIEKKTSIFCNAIVNISDNEYKMARDYKIADDKKMITIHNGIDIQKYKHKNYCKEEVLKELNIPKDSFIVGMVARITEQKDPLKFVELAKVICNKVDNAYFVLVGEGELRQNVESLIQQYQLEDKIKITGWVNDVNKYIHVFDVGILTSRWEGFGLVIAEYMRASKPIIASNVGGIPELIQDSYNGVLVDVDDLDKFTKSILAFYKDEKLREKYINNSKHVLEHKFNINKVIEKHDELYKKVLYKN